MGYRKQFVADSAGGLRLHKRDPEYKGHHESEEAAQPQSGHGCD